MLDWMRRLLQRAPRRMPHEPEVKKAQAEQKRKFSEWKSTLREVARVEKIAKDRHTELHRPR